MFKDIIIGQYVPGNSPLHKMNPPVKIIMTILYIILLFILKNPISYVVFTIYTITLILISGVPFKMILKGLKRRMSPHCGNRCSQCAASGRKQRIRSFCMPLKNPVLWWTPIPGAFFRGTAWFRRMWNTANSGIFSKTFCLWMSATTFSLK